MSRRHATGPRPRTPMRPSYRDREPLPLAEIAPPGHVAGLVNRSNSYLRAYRLGECSVLATREFGRYHLSVAHPSRYPRWEEISEAWYRLIPGAKQRHAALILPPVHEYVNLHEWCMQVLEIPASCLESESPCS